MYTLMRKTELADNRTLKQKIKQKPLQKRQYITKPDANQINLAVVNWKWHTYLGFLLGLWMLFTLVTCFGYRNFACRNNLAIPVIRIIYIWRKLPFLYLYKLISNYIKHVKGFYGIWVCLNVRKKQVWSLYC